MEEEMKQDYSLVQKDCLLMQKDCLLMQKTLFVDEVIVNGVDGESGKRVNLQLPENVSSMCDDRIDRNEQLVGNFLV